MNAFNDDDEAYDSDNALTFEQAKKSAAVMGLAVKIPKANELFIDLDSEEAWLRFLINRGKLFGPDGEAVTQVSISKSGLPHRHVILTLKRDLSALERIALQSMLGSDPTREILSYKRLLLGNPHPILFFEKAA
jgi:hypothetical protein